MQASGNGLRLGIFSPVPGCNVRLCAARRNGRPHAAKKAVASRNQSY
jgi:hypothetical protein